MACIPEIIVEPKESLIINPVRIRGNNFKPKCRLTVAASVESLSESISFSSFAYINADDKGCFDMSKTKSIGGTYQGVQPMGLFWSMKNRPNTRDRLQFGNASNPLIYKFKVFENFVVGFDHSNDVCQTEIVRLPYGYNVSRTRIKVGNIHGVLFCPPGDGPFPAVITLYGGTKYRQPIDDVAAILVNHGFVTLALAYFNVADLPRSYSEINIEYFEEAVDYLRSRKVVDKNNIAVYGISKGGSIALAMAYFLQDKIKAVVSMNGSIHNPGGTTSYRGFTIPGLETDPYLIEMSEFNTMLFDKLYRSIQLDDKSLIPFEKSKANLLFIVGLDDKCVDVDHYQLIVNHKLKSHGKHNFELKTFKGMGHLVDSPYMPVCNTALPAVHTSTVKIEYGGRDIKLHALRQLEVWETVVNFLNRVLKVPKSSL